MEIVLQFSLQVHIHDSQELVLLICELSKLGEQPRYDSTIPRVSHQWPALSLRPEIKIFVKSQQIFLNVVPWITIGIGLAVMKMFEDSRIAF